MQGLITAIICSYPGSWLWPTWRAHTCMWYLLTNSNACQNISILSFFTENILSTINCTFLFPGSERWPGPSRPSWPSWSQRKQSEWVYLYLLAWTKLHPNCIHFSPPFFGLITKKGLFREPAWLWWAVIPVSITGLPICLKCRFDCYSKHTQLKRTLLLS